MPPRRSPPRRLWVDQLNAYRQFARGVEDLRSSDVVENKIECGCDQSLSPLAALDALVQEMTACILEPDEIGAGVAQIYGDRLLCSGNAMPQERSKRLHCFLLAKVVDIFEALNQVLNFVGVLHTRHRINPIGMEEGLVVQGFSARCPEVEAMVDRRRHKHLVSQSSSRVGLVARPSLQRQGVDGVVGCGRQKRGPQNDEAGLVLEPGDSFCTLHPVHGQHGI